MCIRKPALAVAFAAVFSLSACTQAQLDQADAYQAQIARVCAMASALAPIAGPYAVWIIGACSTEAAIAKLALDPSSLAWLHDIIVKVRDR